MGEPTAEHKAPRQKPPEPGSGRFCFYKITSSFFFTINWCYIIDIQPRLKCKEELKFYNSICIPLELTTQNLVEDFMFQVKGMYTSHFLLQSAESISDTITDRYFWIIRNLIYNIFEQTRRKFNNDKHIYF